MKRLELTSRQANRNFSQLSSDVIGSKSFQMNQLFNHSTFAPIHTAKAPEIIIPIEEEEEESKGLEVNFSNKLETFIDSLSTEYNMNKKDIISELKNILCNF